MPLSNFKPNNCFILPEIYLLNHKTNRNIKNHFNGGIAIPIYGIRVA
jgi:hypothetical protein